MGIKKTSSLKISFLKFLCMLFIGLIASAAVPVGLILAGTSSGLITYADYSERMTKNIVPVIAATPNLKDVQLPAGCRYLVLDKNYQVLQTSLDGRDLDRAMEYAMSGKLNENLNKQYLFVTRKNEYVVLQYYIGSQFTNEWLYQHFPSPEILLYGLMGINALTVCVLLTSRLARKLRAQLSPIFEATEQVAQQNLEFEIGTSKIKEFQDVLTSFASMKDNLKESLEKQWNVQQSKREQIAALAHDLKTPLTVIQGNIDLMNETELDEEQKLYAGYIAESSEQIGTYIKMLIDISRAADGYKLDLENFDAAEYMSSIQEQANSLCLAKGLSLSMEIEKGLGTIKADKLLLERAIMNVIDNAIAFSPANATLLVSAQKAENFLQISVTDEGCGFTPEILQHAQEQFFMGDDSRTSDMHFGMGLYITERIIKQLNGSLVLQNSDMTNGAQVIMRIPFLMLALLV